MGSFELRGALPAGSGGALTCPGGAGHPQWYSARGCGLNEPPTASREPCWRAPSLPTGPADHPVPSIDSDARSFENCTEPANRPWSDPNTVSSGRRRTPLVGEPWLQRGHPPVRSSHPRKGAHLHARASARLDGQRAGAESADHPVPPTRCDRAVPVSARVEPGLRPEGRDAWSCPMHTLQRDRSAAHATGDGARRAWPARRPHRFARRGIQTPPGADCDRIRSERGPGSLDSARAAGPKA